MKAAHLLLFAILSITSARADPHPSFRCSSYPSSILRKDVRYCLDRPTSDGSDLEGVPVVYYMHGAFGNARYWEKKGYADTIQSLRRNENYPAVTFVTFDTSPISFFSDLGDTHSGHHAFETWFVDEFIPYIESTHHVCARRECRAIAGTSLGGFGALQTALRHPELFYLAAVNSPALAPFNVHESFWKWLAYFDRHPVGPLKGFMYLYKAHRVFPTWKSSDEHDPAILAEDFPDLAEFPILYFDMGSRDTFGFQEGYARFERALDARGFAHHSELIPGAGHEIFRARSWSLLRFIGAHLPK